MKTYTAEDLAHAEKKAAEWEAKGDVARPGSATRHEAWEQARKWERTAEMIRQAL